MVAAAFSATAIITTTVHAQSGLQTDPATGIVYQSQTTTVERPVVETKLEQREQTVYRPQTVTETRPQHRTVYTPIVEYNWEPRMHGRWNPFTQPTIHYHHVGRTKWEARNERIDHVATRTEWVAEKRTVEVPTQVVRIQREQKTDYVPVGRVQPSGTPAGGDSIAARLRPLNSNETVSPISPAPQYASNGYYNSPQIAAGTVGRMTSDPPQRSVSQSGMPASNLSPGVYGQPLPPASNGIATLPSLPIFR
jgi:hypothetical protein